VQLNKGIRDTILFVVGVAGVVYETLAEQVDRPYLLAAFLGMVGLPVFIRKDERDDDKGKR
jgi:hypothetical protein